MTYRPGKIHLAWFLSVMPWVFVRPSVALPTHITHHDIAKSWRTLVQLEKRNGHVLIEVLSVRERLCNS